MYLICLLATLISLIAVSLNLLIYYRILRKIKRLKRMSNKDRISGGFSQLLAHSIIIRNLIATKGSSDK